MGEAVIVWRMNLAALTNKDMLTFTPNHMDSAKSFRYTVYLCHVHLRAVWLYDLLIFVYTGH